MIVVRTFTADELYALGILDLDPGERDDETGATVILDEMVEHKRWSIRHRLVFRLKDQPEDEAWSVSYFVPATESQECDTWGWQPDKVEARRVRRAIKQIEVWE